MAGKFTKALGVREQTYRMNIIDPRTGIQMRDKNGKGCFIDFYSANSSRSEEKRRSMFDAQAARRGRFQQQGMTYDEATENEAHYLASLVGGEWYLCDWAGETITENDGSPLKVSYDNACDLFTGVEMQWLRDQANEAVKTDANFLPRAATSSASGPQSTTPPTSERTKTE